VAKNNNLKTFATIATIVMSFAVAGTAIIVSAVRVESKVESHAKQAKIDLASNIEVHKELKADIDKVEEEGQKTRNDVTAIKTNIEYLREDMKEVLTYIRSLPK
jgi:peptidoglycan hydrolase CwlO-like protein